MRDRLRELYPQCAVELLALSTRGDEILDTSLAKIGGKGLFVKELELALADRRADLAVHSAKDVPMELPAGFALGAIMQREDPRDAFVSNKYQNLEVLPAGGRSAAMLYQAFGIRFSGSRYLTLSSLIRLIPRGCLDTDWFI